MVHSVLELASSRGTHQAVMKGPLQSAEMEAPLCLDSDAPGFAFR